MCCGYFSAGPVCGCVLAAFSLSRALEEAIPGSERSFKFRSDWKNPEAIRRTVDRNLNFSRNKIKEEDNHSSDDKMALQ